ncbi:MAG: glyoxalase [Thiothrix sp.]|nr:MAG: glyoxalase [Thiothrix sp.]
MAITGIDRITYGVEDMASAQRFFTDWGLKPLTTEAEHLLFSTQDGSQIEVCKLDNPELAPAFETGSTLREVIWGVESQADVDALVAKLKSHPEVPQVAARDGIERFIDPNGMCIGFRVSERHHAPVKGSVMNTYDRPDARIDERSTVYDRAEPVKVGHVVFFAPNLEQTEQFYRELLGFQVSDRYPHRGVFLRCNPAGGHHDMFLLRVSETRRGVNHVAFTVRDIHEVFGGGLHISRCGWKTQIGPGRHPISSAYFWYVNNPCGGLAEYYSDEDYLTADWQPKEDWVTCNENYAEWAINGGVDGHTRRQYLPE